MLATSSIIAQEKLSEEEKARREKNIEAGNPFKQFGYKAKVATLSKGKYLEVHDLDSIVVIGSVRFHVEKKKIVGFVVPDSINGVYARPIGDMPSRWFSPDPLAEEFTSWSPYNFVYNSPLKYSDPTGMAPEWKPDRNGDLIAEKGDNTKTLAKYLDRTVSDVAKNFKQGGESIGENRQFKAGEKVELNNNMTKSIENSNTTSDYNVKTDCYNCHGAAIAAVKGDQINPTTAGFKDLADPFNSEVKNLKKDLKVISSSSEAVFGKTILSFGDHSAVFYGTDNSGTNYFYSKNGATEKPGVFTEQELKNIYSNNPNPTLLNYEPKK